MASIQKADVVIVGTGVAGALIAHQLANAGKRVVMLEAGPRLTRGEITGNFRSSAFKSDFQSPYPCTDYAPIPTMHPKNDYFIQSGEHSYDAQYLRLVGGTTWHWAASAWRYLPVDFKLKSTYGVGVDWPLDYDALEPWYQRAEEALGVWGPNDEALGSPRSKPYPMTPLPLSYNEHLIKARLNEHGFGIVTEPVARNSRPYDGRPTCCGNNNCMPICPIGAMYGGIIHVEKAEKAGAKVVPEAVVYRIETGDNNRVIAVHYKDPQGMSHRVEGKYFVIAANGIETPKLLQISVDSRNPNGIANSSGGVGRHLMDHPGIGVRFYAKEPLWPGRGPQEMTSSVAWRDGDFRSRAAGKKIHLSNMSRVDQVTQELLAGDSLIFGAELEEQIRDRAARFVQFDSFHELMPLPENRIVPSKQHTDKLGIPKPEFFYRIDDYVKRGAAHTREMYTRAAELLGGTDIQYADDFANNQHICGTVMMGATAETGVVDQHCRTFDHDNLFLATSGVMPTVGTVNCTLTVAALSLRMADVIKAEV